MIFRVIMLGCPLGESFCDISVVVSLDLDKVSHALGLEPLSQYALVNHLDDLLALILELPLYLSLIDLEVPLHVHKLRLLIVHHNIHCFYRLFGFRY